MSVFINKFNIFQLINYLYPNAIVTCSPEGTATQQFSSLVWRDSEVVPPYENPNPKPTQLELENKWDECYIYLKRKEMVEKLKLKREQIVEGAVIYNSVTYNSTNEERNRLREAALNGDGIWEVTDIDGIKRTLCLADIQAIVSLYIKLRREADINYFAIQTNINNSSDPETVDIDVGWPVIPYQTM